MRNQPNTLHEDALPRLQFDEQFDEYMTEYFNALQKLALLWMEPAGNA